MGSRPGRVPSTRDGGGEQGLGPGSGERWAPVARIRDVKPLFPKRALWGQVWLRQEEGLRVPARNVKGNEGWRAWSPGHDRSGTEAVGQVARSQPGRRQGAQSKQSEAGSKQPGKQERTLRLLCAGVPKAGPEI